MAEPVASSVLTRQPVAGSLGGRGLSSGGISGRMPGRTHFATDGVSKAELTVVVGPIDADGRIADDECV